MRRLTVQLFLPVLLVILAFLLVALLYWSRAFDRLHVESLTERLASEARLVADTLPVDMQGAKLDELCRLHAREIGGRVTVIAADGAVLGESEEPSAMMENHGQRPEILEARAGGVGKLSRFSHTIGTDMLYVAIADQRGGALRFVRVALPLRALAETRQLVRRILAYGFLLSLVLGGGAAVLFSHRLAVRIHRIEVLSRGILSGREASEGGAGEAPADELGALERRLLDLAREMRAQLAATEDERAKLETVLRSMADGVVVLDGNGKIVLCNRSAVEQLGFPDAGAVIGKKLSFHCRNPDLIGLIEDLLAARSADLPREIIFDGRELSRVVSLSGTSLTEEGRLSGALLVFHDMTRVRQLEAVRSDFVANVSHELRTPLTAIRGYAETLLDGAIEDSDRAAQFVRVIQRHSERLARLIDDLLTLSDLELGKTELRLRPVALDGLVDAVLEVLRPAASGKQIDLVVEIPDGFPKLRGDRDRIEQVLINLLDNAIKYSGAGTRVRVRACRIEPKSGAERIEVRVEDQGIGIPAHDIPRLTERFYRVDRGRSRELGGTGLGLAIVKHIVQAHGGSIVIESQANVGTTVRVILPVEGVAG